MQTIVVINASSVVSDSDLAEPILACQTQIDRDFGPEWGAFAELKFATNAEARAGSLDPLAWWMTILDTSDSPGAAGYHDLTNTGRPAGKVFALTEKNVGADWRVCLSHEILEMLADPDVNQVVLSSATRAVAKEVADAPEADEFAYMIGNCPVSDFVTRAWFESFRERGEVKFDQIGRLSMPYSLLPGGYMSVLDLNVSAEGWRQVTNNLGLSAIQNLRVRPRTGSRREKRRLGPDTWLHSTVGSKDRDPVPVFGRKILV